ncbi:MAG: sensor histidine kinase, partial [bacterium]
RPRALARIAARNDAFGELAREFDRMSARIEKLVSEHRRLLRDVSHELRSPLSRMQVAATLLENGIGDGDDHDGIKKRETRAQIARIQSEILRLEAMIAQLLSLTRLQAGAIELRVAPVELRAMLQRIARDAAYEFAGRGKRVEVAGDALIVRADVAQLRSAFENVIRNGLRHAESKVTVTLERVESNARVAVADDGAGVAQDELRSIFAPFYRPDPSRSEATGNAGLGLAIAEGIVAAHGGRIAATNARGDGGGGLIVTIELPLSAQTETAQTA